jgi:hypothetical protein
MVLPFRLVGIGGKSLAFFEKMWYTINSKEKGEQRHDESI